MRNLIKISLSAFLILFLSACQENLNTPSKPKIDTSLEKIDFQSIRSLSDIKAIAFEWQKVDDPRVIGYNIYRAKDFENKAKLKRIAFIENRYTSHYLDKDLESNTAYVYGFSSAREDDYESKISLKVKATTSKVPDAVAFIQAISNLPRQIKVVWRPHTNAQISYYKIQRSSPVDSSWDTLETLDGRLQAEFIDTDLDDNVIYKYRVIAYTFDDIRSDTSLVVSAQTKPLPRGIINLRASQDQPKKIVITWDASPEEDIIQYVIYRNSTPNGNFDKIRNVNKNTFLYEYKEHEDGKNIFFKVTAIDKDKLESSRNINSVMGTTLVKPLKPIMTLAQIKENKAILNWKEGDNRATSYIIYKTIQKGYFSSESVKYTNVKGLRFEDEKIVRGVEYKYSIQAVDEFGILSIKTDESLLVLPKLQK